MYERTSSSDKISINNECNRTKHQEPFNVNQLRENVETTETIEQKDALNCNLQTRHEHEEHLQHLEQSDKFVMNSNFSLSTINHVAPTVYRTLSSPKSTKSIKNYRANVQNVKNANHFYAWVGGITSCLLGIVYIFLRSNI